MNNEKKTRYRFLLCLGLATTLTACQNAPTVVDRFELSQTTLENKVNNATLYCSGVENCEFERINDIVVMDAKSHIVSVNAGNGTWHHPPGWFGFYRKQQVYLNIPAKQYEVVIRFYPISPDRAKCSM